jgi:hypothetical protein
MTLKVKGLMFEDVPFSFEHGGFGLKGESLTLEGLPSALKREQLTFKG